MKIIQVTNDEYLKILSNLSYTVWHEFFPSILSMEQIDYMVHKFQSFDAMKKQINEGYEYYLFQLDDEFIGYTGIKVEDDKLFISKLYLLKSSRGKHLIKDAFNFYELVCKKNSLNSLYLTVNKYNRHAIDVYLHYGFNITNDVVTDIGNGFVMDDYIMEKELL